MINKTKRKIMIEGHIGTWYEIDVKEYYGKKLYLMESEIYGEGLPSIIIDENNNEIVQEIYNGFEDLDERIECIDEYEDDDIMLIRLVRGDL